jgi:hypothetical protein
MARRISFALIVILIAIGVGGAAGKPDRKAGTQTLSLPDKSWSLLVDLPGFKRDEHSTLPDGSGTMIQASNKKTGLVASVFLESRPDLDSTEACEADYWGQASKSPLPKSEVQHVTVGPLAVVHWLVREYLGLPLMQKNVNAYLYRDGVCIDVHLSKVQYEPKDEALFTAVLTSVRFSDQ